jgi:uncharacterized protein YraI
VKKVNSGLFIFILPILLVLGSLGCSLSSRLGQLPSPNESAPTRTPMPTFTPTAAGSAFVDISAINTPTPLAQITQPQSVVPTPTPPPAEPPTATPSPAPAEITVTVLQNMNVRGGPGTNYSVVGAGQAGQSTKVIGRNADGTWLQVEYPSADGKGWVFTELVQVNGNAQTVAVVEAPPPPAVVAAPAPAPAPAEEQPQAEAPPPAPSYQFTPTGWSATENGAIVQFKGRIRNEGGGLINGFSVLADNGAFRVLSHPTGASQWYPDKGDGEWDIVMPNIATAQGWWWLTVVKYDCNFAGGFDAQCQSYTKLSEDVKIQVVTPEESIINADWVCHWDCDKGLYVDAYRRP